ncbi:MAG TPA: TadE/TadG family type IV pilus assembly protein [Anaerolineales bacterium]|nr:TadE/TadG family type IV pilus assembly protein [Anaerolineales bacterium]
MLKNNNSQHPLKHHSNFRVIGQSIVEFALVIPLLILLIFGALDLGRVFQAAITLTNSVREGARYGTLYPDATITQIEAAVQAEAESTGMDLSSATITRTCTYLGSEVTTLPAGGSCASDAPINVSITYNFELILGGLFGMEYLDLKRSAEMYVP